MARSHNMTPARRAALKRAQAASAAKRRRGGKKRSKAVSRRNRSMHVEDHLLGKSGPNKLTNYNNAKTVKQVRAIHKANHKKIGRGHRAANKNLKAETKHLGFGPTRYAARSGVRTNNYNVSAYAYHANRVGAKNAAHQIKKRKKASAKAHRARKGM